MNLVTMAYSFCATLAEEKKIAHCQFAISVMHSSNINDPVHKST